MTNQILFHEQWTSHLAQGETFHGLCNPDPNSFLIRLPESQTMQEENKQPAGRSVEKTLNHSSPGPFSHLLWEVLYARFPSGPPGTISFWHLGLGNSMQFNVFIYVPLLPPILFPQGGQWTQRQPWSYVKMVAGTKKTSTSWYLKKILIHHITNPRSLQLKNGYCLIFTLWPALWALVSWPSHVTILPSHHFLSPHL